MVVSPKSYEKYVFGNGRCAMWPKCNNDSGDQTAEEGEGQHGSTHQAAGTPLVTCGVDVFGFSDSHLLTTRRAIAKAASPEAGGKSAQLVLYVADGAHGAMDPSFAAHALGLQMWALAHWQKCFPQNQLQPAIERALCSPALASAQPNWRWVRGSAVALVG